MNKPFLPPLDSLWELTEDWQVPVPFMTRYGNTEFAQCMGIDITLGAWPKYGPGYTWDDAARAEWIEWRNQRMAEGDATIPAGSIFSMERYHVSRSGEDEVTLKMYRSPRLEISPKKRGGKGKGHMRFYVSLAEFNTFPILKGFEA